MGHIAQFRVKYSHRRPLTLLWFIGGVYFLQKDVVWDIFVFALGNTPGFHLIRAKVCSVFKLKFALNIPYYVYLFLETRHTISRCHIATHFDLKACPSTCLNLQSKAKVMSGHCLHFMGLLPKVRIS